mmetsp:Transcript_17120/g.44587  ORF Transcript_17120/g.44587 Transcript_17120/m.44587 type:complete len:233 (-) Transcript_17120:2324-3022(-)
MGTAEAGSCRLVPSGPTPTSLAGLSSGRGRLAGGGGVAASCAASAFRFRSAAAAAAAAASASTTGSGLAYTSASVGILYDRFSTTRFPRPRFMLTRSFSPACHATAPSERIIQGGRSSSVRRRGPGDRVVASRSICSYSSNSPGRRASMRLSSESFGIDTSSSVSASVSSAISSFWRYSLRSLSEDDWLYLPAWMTWSSICSLKRAVSRICSSIELTVMSLKTRTSFCCPIR